jgi:Notch-like protein
LFTLDPCSEENCSSHGTCSVDSDNTTDGYLCTCSLGYTGNDCENDPCFKENCSSHGTCSVDAGDTTDGYLCTCSPGYTGNDCELGKQFLHIGIIAAFIYNRLELMYSIS